MSVVLASRLLTSMPLHERVATTDFFHDAAKAAQKAEISFFMLGGSEEENAAACAAVRHLYPRLKIAGRHHGYFAEPANIGRATGRVSGCQYGALPVVAAIFNKQT